VPMRILGVHWRTWYRLAPEAAYLLARLGLPTVRWAAALWAAVQRRWFGDLEDRGLRLQRGRELVAHWNAYRAPLTAGPFVDLVRRGEVAVLPALQALHPGEAETVDGGRHACEAVVLATGYRPALEELLELAVLHELGIETSTSGAVPAAPLARLPDGRPGPLPGLWFCGYLPELVRIGHAARRVARCVAAETLG